MEPFVELPVIYSVGLGEPFQHILCELRLAESRKRHRPEPADEWPRAAVVILEFKVLAVTPHIGTPQRIGAGDGVEHACPRPRLIHRGLLQGMQDAVGRTIIGEAEQDGEQVTQHVTLFAPEGKIDEAQVELPTLGTVAHIVGE